MNGKRLIPVLLAAAVCGSLHAAEAEAPPEEAIRSYYDLNEIVVTSTRTPLLLKDTPVLTRVITAEEIEKSGLHSIQDVLQNYVAGVEFHQTGYGSSISFQGLDARYVLFLVDGERMAGETYGNIDYARIPLADIQRIEIVRGASSVLYGSNAMGAVVNVITRIPQDRIDLRASGRYGTNYQRQKELPGGSHGRSKLDIPNIDADLYAGFDFGKLKSRTTVSYNGSDSYKLYGNRDEIRRYGNLTVMDKTFGMQGPGYDARIVRDTTIAVAPDSLGLSVSGWRNIYAGHRFDYEFTEKFSAYHAGRYFGKNRYDAQESINTCSADGGDWTSEKYNAYNLKGGIEWNPDGNHVVRLTYNGDFYRRYLDSLQYLVPKQRHSYHAPRAMWTGRAGDYHRVTAGVELLQEKLHFDLSRFGYEDKRRLNSTSVYLQDEIETRTPFSFTAGIRFDHNNKFKWSVMPKASVKYSVGNCSLRANYSMGYRNPTIKELWMNYLIPMGTNSPDMYIIGNPDLKREFNQYFSLAAEYIDGTTHVSVTGFTSLFRDKIDVRNTQVGDNEYHLVYENIDKSRYSGLELLARARVARGLFLMGNYNYIFQKEDAPESSTQYVFVSPHTAVLQADYVFGAMGTEFGLNVTGKYIGKKEYEDLMTVIEYDPGSMIPAMPSRILSGNYKADHNAYTLWNVSASASVTKKLKIIAGVDNLFDYRSPVVNFNASMSPKRNGFVKLIFHFTEP